MTWLKDSPPREGCKPGNQTENFYRRWRDIGGCNAADSGHIVDFNEGHASGTVGAVDLHGVVAGRERDEQRGQRDYTMWDIDRVIIAKIESQLRAVSDWELLKLCEIVDIAPNEMLGWEASP